jgi:hypothetical protein
VAGGYVQIVGGKAQDYELARISHTG